MSHYRCQNVEGKLKRNESTFETMSLAKAAWRLSYHKVGVPEFRQEFSSTEVFLNNELIGYIFQTYASPFAKDKVDHL